MAFHKLARPARIEGSPQQKAIWDCLASTQSNVVIEALAGCGKTFTILRGMEYITGTAGFTCFNASIRDELTAKVPEGTQALTFHQLGLRAITANLGRAKIDKDKEEDILESYDPDMRFLVRLATLKVVGLVKNNLLDPTDEFLDEAAAYYGVDLNGSRTEIYEATRHVLEESKRITSVVSFDDMIWLPSALNLSVPHFETLFVDECQDLNKAQQQLILKAADRFVIVGDSHQAIYGFRGADTRSMATMRDILQRTQRGCEVFPLTVTRRCPKAHVRLAATLVPDFTALDDAPVGELESIQTVDIYNKAMPGDLILCRVNAPLVSSCYQFIKRGIRARILGRDFGKGLTAIVNKLGAVGIPDLARKLDDYRLAEEKRIMARKRGQETALMILNDRLECLQALMEGCPSVEELKANIAQMFTEKDDRGEKVPTVTHSSVHKAKGLEADSVFILDGSKMPHPMAKSDWEKEQEYNILYVAITRSKRRLVFVGEVPPPIQAAYVSKTFTNYEAQADVAFNPDSLSGPFGEMDPEDILPEKPAAKPKAKTAKPTKKAKTVKKPAKSKK